MRQFHIDDLVITQHDPSVSGFMFNKVVDWYSGSTSKSQFESRPGANGSFGTPTINYGDLVVSVEGIYLGVDEQSTDRARIKFGGIKKRGQYVRIAFLDSLGLTYRNAQVARTHIPHTSSKVTFSWSADFICTDTRRYGEYQDVGVITKPPTATGGLQFPITFPITFGTSGSSGRITLHNTDGTDDAPILFKVSGYLENGFVITNVTTGQILRLDRIVPDGSIIYLNTKNGSVTIDGQSTLTLTDSDWSLVPAGESHTFQFSALGDFSPSAQLEALFAPAFN